MPAVRVRFEDLAAGDEVPPLSRMVTREDVKRYADASGDHNPLHQNDDVARAVGFPRRSWSRRAVAIGRPRNRRFNAIRSPR